MNIQASIFKAYDIRGVLGAGLDVQVALHLGQAFGTHALSQGETVVAVGRDGRVSGPDLAEALIEGLLSTGVTVLDVGMVTTPMVYYAAATHCRSGIQVTGSHNPKNYNGFKMVLAGRAIYGDEIQHLRHLIEQEAYAQGEGEYHQVDIHDEYQERIISDVKLSRPMKVVVDCGNGVPGASAPGILRALGCEVLELYSEVDGDFPNHHPDPSKPENLADVVALLKNSDAELGLAFDGDGDRVGVVTRDGHIIYPDRQLMLLAQEVLSRHPGASILYDVKCSGQVAPFIRAHGGVPVMTPTGHSLVKAQLRETGAPLAGEMSGHIFFKDRWYGFDDATYCAARLLEILSRSDNPSQVLDALPSAFNTPELNIACAEGEPHQVMATLKAVAHFEDALELITIDGLRVEFADGFGLVRASNTTPVLVLRFEGQTAEAATRIQQRFMDLIQSVKPDAQIAHSAH
jgi:phosphomannomutase